MTRAGRRPGTLGGFQTSREGRNPAKPGLPHAFVLLLLTAVGGVACQSQSDLLTKRDAGADSFSGGSGPDGGDGGKPEPDGAPDGIADGSTDAEPPPFVGYRWVTLPAIVGAPITAMAIDSEGVVYAGAEGIFKSTDEGASWHEAGVGLYDYDIGDLATVGTTVYAASANIERSADRAASWQPVVEAIVPTPFKYIRGQGALVVAVVDGNPYYVSADAGNTFQTLQGSWFAPTGLEVLAGGSVIIASGRDGVFRSTDLGMSFHPVQGIANGSDLYAWLICDGVTTCYGRAYTSSSAPDGVLLKSIDGGATWTPLPATAEASMGVAAQMLAISDTGSVYVQFALTLARSDDGGASFSPIPNPIPPTDTDPYRFCGGPYVARGDQVFAGCLDGVHRSNDQGEHWQSASGSPTNGAITGAPAWIFADNSPTALGPGGDLYVGGVEGLDTLGEPASTVKRSSDGGGTWQMLPPVFGSGCIVTPAGAFECQATPSLPSDGSYPLGRSDDHGATWRNIEIEAGLNSPIATVLATFGSIVYLAGGEGVARSTDDGLTFQVIPGSPDTAALQVLRSGHLLATEPNGSAGYRSTDQGATWEPIDNLTLPLVEGPTGGLIRYAKNDSDLEVSMDEARTWSLLADRGFPADPILTVPPVVDGAGHLFVFGYPSASEPGRIFASADGGAQFLPLPAQIPNPTPVPFAIAIDKQGRLLVGTAGGLFRLESGSGGP